MFDLPVVTKAQRSRAAKFRNALLDLGFDRVQLSVYATYLPNAAQSQRIVRTIQEEVPPGGAVRILRLSDAVWSSMKRYEGKAQVEPEAVSEQLLLFD